MSYQDLNQSTDKSKYKEDSMKGLLSLVFLFSTTAFAAKVGSPAPQFKAKDAFGKEVSLADYKGKWVVLEWYNKDCPYVKKHYGSNNMQTLQKKYADKGAVWLTLISSAKGEQGYLDNSAAQKQMKDTKMASAHLLIDPSGEVGKAYDAKTTPHMFVINPEQTIAYAGAIDDNNSSDPKVIAKSKNFVDLALASGMENKPITTSSTAPYGCSIKYQ